MGKIANSFKFGDIENQEELIALLEKMYRQLSEAINLKPNVYLRDVDGQTTDTFLSNGDFNINTGTLKVEMLTEHTDPTTVVWNTL